MDILKKSYEAICKKNPSTLTVTQQASDYNKDCRANQVDILLFYIRVFIDTGSLKKAGGEKLNLLKKSKNLT